MKCIVCEVEFVPPVNCPSKKYCKTACRSKAWKLRHREQYLKGSAAYNKKVQHSKEANRSLVKKVCEFCKKSFVVSIRNPYQKFCGELCRNKNFKKNNPEKVREYSKKERKKNSEHYRDREAKRHNEKAFDGNRFAVLDRDENKCVVCGLEQGLVVHHKDCSKKNNSPENLITLCRGCHCQVHRAIDGKMVKFDHEALVDIVSTGCTSHTMHN